MTPRVVDFVLADGEVAHLASPRTFFVPDRIEREFLQVGSVVRLLFEVVDPDEGMPRAERMWVEVSGRDGDGYVGVLTNTPGVITTVAMGDEVRFAPEHVIAIVTDWALLEKKMLVSRRSHDDDVRPGWIYRESPDSEIDSGWRAMVGDETDDEIEDVNSILLQDLGFLLDRWPELRPVFETDPANGEWAWDDELGRYVSVPLSE